jgi:hypothetical protein
MELKSTSAIAGTKKDLSSSSSRLFTLLVIAATVITVIIAEMGLPMSVLSS